MNTQTLSQSVQEAIRQNLSGVVAGELSDFIEQSKRQKVELERTREQNASMKTEIEDLLTRLQSHRNMDERESEMAKRESVVQFNEIELLKHEAFLEAKIAHAELSGVKYSMEAFLKNATVRETVVANVAKPVEGYPGGNGMSGGPGFLTRDHQPDTTTTTRTTE